MMHDAIGLLCGAVAPVVHGNNKLCHANHAAATWVIAYCALAHSSGKSNNAAVVTTPASHGY
jgi:hypothetical protein